VIALLLVGPEDAPATELIVVVGAIIAAFAIRPVAELGWNYVWAPWRSLVSDVAAIRASLASPTKQDAPVDVHLTALDYLRRYRDDVLGGTFGGWAQQRAESDWAALVKRFLNKHASRHITEDFMQADAADRYGVLERFAESVAPEE
jgi:hypothetical protein